MEKCLVIGIAGGSGSGKTTLLKNIMETFGPAITVISHDNYYKRHDEMTYEERCQLNYDEPAALETDLMVRQLAELRSGKEIQCPVYDFTVHNRSDETICIKPERVIIVEGILIFENKELRGYRCGHPHLQKNQAGCKQAGQKSGVCDFAVSADGEAHA